MLWWNLSLIILTCLSQIMLFIGITFPSKDGQSTLMKEVYKRSEIKTDDIAFMEMHSTGTPVSLNILKGFQWNIFCFCLGKMDIQFTQVLVNILFWQKLIIISYQSLNLGIFVLKMILYLPVISITDTTMIKYLVRLGHGC